MISKIIEKLRRGNLLGRLDDRLVLLKVKNRNVWARYKHAKSYYALKKRFKKTLASSPDMGGGTDDEQFIVWTCWFQGEENAPALVKACFESMRNCFSDCEVIVLTEDNFKQFVTIPDYILEKYERGIISNAHFSDILRIEVLYKHGGLWLDSTVFVTAHSAPDYITDSRLFVYKSIELNKYANPIVASNWLIRAKKGSQIIAKTRELLFEYWKKYNKVRDYFFFHIFFTMATEMFPDEWEFIPTFSNIPPHILQFELLNSFTKTRLDQILRGADFHKLNWRIESDGTKNSFYDFLVKT